ncbi:MAG TPA: hypothetical protein VJO53_07065 [Candidatus Acidoferrales bacterium]|nr:hypothetical protein [Candidatus Acidoferrales bacterium]
MPLLARNLFLHGYQGQGAEIQPTEFLILLRRYVQQARELETLAGPGGTIRVSGCDDAKQVLQILGYRTRPDCGKSGTFLETADSKRAFVTIDSGFPISDLEKTLQGGEVFAYTFPTSRVPVLLGARDWTTASEGGSKENAEFIDAILHDHALARLYHACAGMDPETQIALRKSPGLKKLLPVAASLDFYGDFIRIRSGRVMVPGGARTEPGWKNLVGVSPESSGEFVLRLLAKDNGWLAAFYDSLARVGPAQQAYLTDPSRLQHLYEALRGKYASPSATASTFRPDPDLLLLMTRLQFDPNGEPRVPGNLLAWKTILSRQANSRLARSRGVRFGSLNNSEGLLEAMFALSRVQIDDGPSQAYLMLSELDSRRPEGRRLSAQTVELMAGEFPEFKDQYLIFSEFPELSDASVALFLKTSGALEKIPDHTLRGNAMGIFQANVGLWQILARQSQIPPAGQDASWRAVVKEFAQISSPAQLFDAGRQSLVELQQAAGGKPQGSQNGMIELIAGPPQSSLAGQQMHAQMAERIRAVMEDQRLVSLDTLLALGDGLNKMAQGAPIGDSLVPLAEQLQEFQMPRPIFSRSERTEWAAGTYNNRHTDLQMRTDLVKVVKAPPSGDQLREARGELAPFLRDTLVGLNYAYYEPPGAQALHNNPLLVRSHDFSGETVIGMDRLLWRRPRLLGAGSPAGGGAHFVGSLADLPYVLAQMEQDFVVPENIQALIWSDLVPGVLTNAELPRWWNVTRNELHAVALYQRAGEELLAAAAANDELRSKVTSVLSDRMIPQRSWWLENSLQEKRSTDISVQLTPADLFYLTAEFRRSYPTELSSCGPAGKELEVLLRQYPAEVDGDRLSQDFGVPHPVLEKTYARDLLSVQPFPMFEGYSSRLLAETWDSTNLYWARLADEMDYPPVALNTLVPTLTVRMIAKIFASDLDDWPAILRAMRETGEDFRHGRIASLPVISGALRP